VNLGLFTDAFLGIVFADAGPSDLIRLSAESRRDFGDLSYFFTRRGSSPCWTWPPGANALSADTPRAVVARNADTFVSWSPLLYEMSPMTTSRARLPVVWCSIPLSVVPSRARGLENYGSVDPESERTAFARFAAVSPPPSFVLHEGQRFVAFWRLKEALTAPAEPITENRNGRWPHSLDEQVRAQVLLWHLAQMLDGSRDLDPRKQTFAVPGVAMSTIFPRRETFVLLGSDPDRRYSVDEF